MGIIEELKSVANLTDGMTPGSVLGGSEFIDFKLVVVFVSTVDNLMSVIDLETEVSTLDLQIDVFVIGAFEVASMLREFVSMAFSNFLDISDWTFGKVLLFG